MWTWYLKELIVGAGLALLIGGGYWQGSQSGRFSPPAEVVAADLALLPRELKDWTATDFQLDPKDLASAGITTYVARNYFHRVSGETVTVLLLAGAGGPISVHAPEVCFAGRGYQKESAAVKVRRPNAAGGDEHEFSMAIFQGPESDDRHRVQLWWAWSDSGIWTAPDNPRLAYARAPRLYKMYVSRPLRSAEGRQNVETCRDFLDLITPEFQRLIGAAAMPVEPTAERIASPTDDDAQSQTP